MTSHRLMRLIAQLFRILTWPFVRYELRGAACLSQHEAWVMSANHRSVFDFPLAVVALDHFGRYARIMIAAEFWQKPAFAWAVKAIDAIPVYRKTDPKGSLSAAIAALKQGDSLCIMPEGTLHWDVANPMPMKRLKTGVSRLAVGAGVPVLPIALVGTERVWPKGAKVPRFGLRRKVVVCRVTDEPLWLTGDDHEANTQKVKEATEALIRQATADLQAIDPTYLPAIAS